MVIGSAVARTLTSVAGAHLGRSRGADICWGEPSRQVPVMLEWLSLYSAECLLPSPRGDTERLPWHTACQAGVVGGSFCTDTR